jgi:hypothetical protein
MDQTSELGLLSADMFGDDYSLDIFGAGLDEFNHSDAFDKWYEKSEQEDALNLGAPTESTSKPILAGPELSDDSAKPDFSGMLADPEPELFSSYEFSGGPQIADDYSDVLANTFGLPAEASPDCDDKATPDCDDKAVIGFDAEASDAEGDEASDDEGDESSDDESDSDEDEDESDSSPSSPIAASPPRCITAVSDWQGFVDDLAREIGAYPDNVKVADIIASATPTDCYNASLTRDEFIAVKLFTSSEIYRQLNDSLRSGMSRGAIGKYSEILSRAIASRPWKSFRTLYRGMNTTPASFLSSSPDRVVRFRGFTSFSVDRYIAADHFSIGSNPCVCYLETVGQTGSNVSDISEVPSEGEVLFAPGLLVQVVSSTVNKRGVRIVELRQVTSTVGKTIIMA